MKIVCISDTHGQHENLKLPDGDMIIHAGDISSRGYPLEVQSFLDWFVKLPYKYKIFIGGNHDFFLEENPSEFKKMLPESVIYLENSNVTISGVKLWGSPVSPRFYDWAFNVDRGPDIRAYWDKIPSDTDILITHGPPFGYGDRTIRGDTVGCEDLLDLVKKIRPTHHIFGHIHEAYGQTQNEYTTFVNASVLNLSYQLVNVPIVIEI